jgi:hypothetical protein
MSNLAFSLTLAERGALLTLERFRAAWPNLDRRTFDALAGKGLVQMVCAAGVARPELTDAGRACCAMLALLPGVRPSGQKIVNDGLSVVNDGNSTPISLGQSAARNADTLKTQPAA